MIESELAHCAEYRFVLIVMAKPKRPTDFGDGKDVNTTSGGVRSLLNSGHGDLAEFSP